ncbi:MAG: hypothetical protein RIB84_19015 [Sneathiellaceae bacterium]
MAEQLPFALPVLSDFGEHAYLIADSNQQAVAWVERWPDWPGRRLLLAGPAGGGKSHLAAIWADRAAAGRCQASSLRADRDIAGACSGGSWLVEDLGGLADERGLLHLVNAVAERGGHLLLTADRPVAQLDLRLPDLRSRLLTFAVAELLPPDDALLAGVLWKLFADRQLLVTDGLVRFLVRRMPRSLAAAGRLVAELDRMALAKGRPVNRAMAREALAMEAERQTMDP